ncbi:MAG: RNA methyltransferase [Spirochaetaceae bacterium]|jgi:TrmH RNA methyltransferase|nr:RNA methyltransferase [Spirochaetaceae bacterium]
MYNKLVDELAVCGLNAVKAVAEYHPQNINRLFLREELLPGFRDICRQLAERKRPYKICDDEELLRICKHQHHQGVVAMIKEAVVEPLTPDDLDLWADEAKTGVVLHSVGNDLNLGAIVRAAAFFGVHFVVISEFDTDARLSTAAYRVAEGGMEHVVIRSVKRTEAFLRAASKRLLVLGTDTRARLRINEVPSLMAEHPGVVLVLGNEEAGLPDQVKRHCAALLRVPGTGNMESLNVAQAAALFLHAIYEA